MIKSRIMKWVCISEYVGKGELFKGIWWGDLLETDHSKELGLDRRTILKWIIKKWYGEPWTR